MDNQLNGKETDTTPTPENFPETNPIWLTYCELNPSEMSFRRGLTDLTAVSAYSDHRAIP
jgi:hypothetical protein